MSAEARTSATGLTDSEEKKREVWLRSILKVKECLRILRLKNANSSAQQNAKTEIAASGQATVNVEGTKIGSSCGVGFKINPKVTEPAKTDGTITARSSQPLTAVQSKIPPAYKKCSECLVKYSESYLLEKEAMHRLKDYYLDKLKAPLRFIFHRTSCAYIHLRVKQSALEMCGSEEILKFLQAQHLYYSEKMQQKRMEMRRSLIDKTTPASHVNGEEQTYDEKQNGGPNAASSSSTQSDGLPLYKKCSDCLESYTESYLLEKFGLSVCDRCRDRDDTYALITRSEAKAEYTLESSDLEKRHPQLRFISHGSSGSYLRLQVKQRALEVWGSEECLIVQKERAKLFKEHMRKYRMEMRQKIRAAAQSDGPPASKRCSDCRGRVSVKEYRKYFLLEKFGQSMCNRCYEHDGSNALISRADAKAEYHLEDFDLDKRKPPLRFILHGSSCTYLHLHVKQRALEVMARKERVKCIAEMQQKRMEMNSRSSSSSQPMAAVQSDGPPLYKKCSDCLESYTESYLSETFGLSVCDRCRDENGAHALISRADALSVYVLKDYDLDKRHPPLRCVLHGSSFSYLHLQVKQKALEVWRSKKILKYLQAQHLYNSTKMQQKMTDMTELIARKERVQLRAYIMQMQHIRAFLSAQSDEHRKCANCLWRMSEREVHILFVRELRPGGVQSCAGEAALEVWGSEENLLARKLFIAQLFKYKTEMEGMLTGNETTRASFEHGNEEEQKYNEKKDVVSQVCTDCRLMNEVEKKWML